MHWTFLFVFLTAAVSVGAQTPSPHWDTHDSCGMIIAPTEERLTEVRTLCSIGLSKLSPDSIEEVLVNPYGALYVKIHPNLAAGFLAARRGTPTAVKARN